MARLSLNKSSLHRQQRQLKIYERFLPSLDLKRRQLIAERAKAEYELAAIQKEIAALTGRVSAHLPMLANREVDLTSLVWIEAIQVEEENRLGTRLPAFQGAEVQIRDYSFLTRPHWVDVAATWIREMILLQLRLQVQQDRVKLLNEAARKITQRVNLFEKVLIPRAREHIRRIRIHLSDAERAAVVRAKLAKSRHRGASG
jgi:V/A-type H+/Na+-transporting ATPase subunit D